MCCILPQPDYQSSESNNKLTSPLITQYAAQQPEAASVFNLDTRRGIINDLTIGWQNGNLLSHPNATLAPQQGKQGRVVKF